MDNARLPIDICEGIIDNCFNPLPGCYIRTIYRTWLVCALVCTAWAPRSRRNLLLDVSVSKASHVDLLLRTFSENPRLADLVLTLAVDGLAAYVPFTRLPMPQILRNCQSLDLLSVNWKHYPSWYLKLVPQYAGVIQLELGVVGLTISQVLRLVWSFPRLQSLQLRGDVTNTYMSESHSMMVGASRTHLKPEACRMLKRLRISMSNLIYMENFPPFNAFGESPTYLRVDMTAGSVSRHMQNCVGGFRQLQRLVFLIFSNGQPSTVESNLLSGVFSTLSHIHSGPLFRTLHLRISPDDMNSYTTTRSAFLGLFCGPHMQSAFQRLPGLEELRLQLDDNDPSRSAEWWTGQILVRMPRLQSIVTVEVHLKDLEFYQNLWDSEPEVAIRLKDPHASNPEPRTHQLEMNSS